MRLRRKIGWVIAAVIGLLAAVIGVAPYLIDVEAYRPAIIEAVRDATGRELVIDGPVQIRMLPVPGIGAGQVRFANAVGAKGAQMVDVRWVSVKPDWLALLSGDEGKREVLVGDQMARSCGIQGVPSFALQGHVLFSGAVPAEEMADSFRRAWELLKNKAA